MRPRFFVALGVLVMMAMTVPASVQATGETTGGSGEQCFEGSGEVGTRIQWVTTDAGVVVRVTFTKNFVDNTYGVNSIGWGKRGHTFSDLIHSDHVELTLKDGAGDDTLQFKVDYLTASSDAPSGYRTLGVTGGDGDMEKGDASDVLSARTSLDENFNVHHYVLTQDSPATDDDYTPNAQYPDWIFDVWYEVTVDPAAFGTAGFGSATMDSVHASPSKTDDTVTVTPVPCEPAPCPDGQVMGDDGQCRPAPCPSGQVMNDNGQCEPAPCPDGQVMGDDGQCAAETCPSGQIMGVDGQCVPAPCPEGQVRGDDGQCGQPTCPSGQVMGTDGECHPGTCEGGMVMGDDGNCHPPTCPSGQTMGDDGHCHDASCPNGQIMGEDGICRAPIPFFPTPMAWVLGTVVSLGGAFFVMRRRNV